MKSCCCPLHFRVRVVVWLFSFSFDAQIGSIDYCLTVKTRRKKCWCLRREWGKLHAVYIMATLAREQQQQQQLAQEQ